MKTLVIVVMLGVAIMAVAAQERRLPEAFVKSLVAAAVAQTRTSVTYDGSYRRIPYPGGDVPETIGVCTDVIVRAFRKVGVDLQVKVHEDMTRAFARYPQSWGLPSPDANIDHRRVPNLQTYFRRCGAALPISRDPRAYEPGDVVTWMLPGNLPHVGLVADRETPAAVPLVVHNIGRGPEIGDALFSYPITGHYRYSGDCGSLQDLVDEVDASRVRLQLRVPLRR